ncbi:MAG TPA: hemin uptake protein HemP [Burkholderiales bacterium]|nr:hemin uptake protein HemP [Burkholderiales bacterium]
MSDRPPGQEQGANTPRPVPTVASSQPRVRSDELLRGRSELVIEHQGREYRLRITQNGKLILTA